MLDLTPEQLILMQDGLNEILQLENTDQKSSSSASHSSSSSRSVDPNSDEMKKKNYLVAMKIRELKQKGIKKLDPIRVLR